MSAIYALSRLAGISLIVRIDAIHSIAESG